MRLENVFLYIVVSVCITIFVHAILEMVAGYENRKGLSVLQKILLLSLVFLSEVSLWIFSPEHLAENTCSMALLLVIAVIDAQTGYVYNCFSYFILFTSGVLAACNWPTPSNYELQLLSIFILFIVCAVALKGLGAGDVPVYFSVMFYYLRYSECPAEAVVFMLLLSQFLFGVGALLGRKKQLPLVPYIWMAHLFTMCIWI